MARRVVHATGGTTRGDAAESMARGAARLAQTGGTACGLSGRGWTTWHVAYNAHATWRTTLMQRGRTTRMTRGGRRAWHSGHSQPSHIAHLDHRRHAADAAAACKRALYSRAQRPHETQGARYRIGLRLGVLVGMVLLFVAREGSVEWLAVSLHRSGNENQRRYAITCLRRCMLHIACCLLHSRCRSVILATK